jgi:Zn-dependent peptidase ImmA (M78 family)/transcriptional regulator with XRE-family HTH domain
MAISNVSLGARVRALRERAGVKSQDLARALGIDPSAMSNIESGKRSVKTDELTRIAGALGVSPLAILDESSLVAHLPVAPRADDGERDGGSVLERLMALAELHEVLAHAGVLAEHALHDVPAVDVEAWKGSAELLAGWAGARLQLPEWDEDRFSALADAIENRLQVDVAVEEHGDGTLAGAAITDTSLPLVFVRASQPRSRALFTLAHELAHVLARDGETFTLDKDLNAHNDSERFANAFAATLLMPAAAVSDEHAQHGLTPVGLARMLTRFGVSFESLVYRLHNLGYINYQGRNRLVKGGIRAVIASLADDEALARNLLTRLAEPRAVETRSPRWLTGRAFSGYRNGIVSARPLAELLGVSVDDLIAHVESPDEIKQAEGQLHDGDDASDEERYSGSPV